MARIHDIIRQRLEEVPGLTQCGLAEFMGLNPAAVNRMVYGRRNIRADEIPLIEKYIGLKLNVHAEDEDIEYRQKTTTGRQGGFSDISPQPLPDKTTIPVYGYAAGCRGKELNLSNGEAVDWVQRHPALLGVKDAFAIYVFSDSMEPRYFPGELVYLHPGRPPENGRDCVIEMRNGDAYIKRLVRQGEKSLRVMQFNPSLEMEIPRSEIKAVYTVVGRG